MIIDDMGKKLFIKMMLDGKNKGRNPNNNNIMLLGDGDPDDLDNIIAQAVAMNILKQLIEDSMDENGNVDQEEADKKILEAIQVITEMKDDMDEGGVDVIDFMDTFYKKFEARNDEEEDDDWTKDEDTLNAILNDILEQQKIEDKHKVISLEDFKEEEQDDEEDMLSDDEYLNFIKSFAERNEDIDDDCFIDDRSLFEDLERQFVPIEKLTEELPGNKYTFAEMIKEFEEGYSGKFVSEDGEDIIYDSSSKMLLIDTELATYPVNLTHDFITQTFTKKIEYITNDEALDLARQGIRTHFEVKICDEIIYGSLTMVNDMPSFRISINDLDHLSPECIILLALFNGDWYLK